MEINSNSLGDGGASASRSTESQPDRENRYVRQPSRSEFRDNNSGYRENGGRQHSSNQGQGRPQQHRRRGRGNHSHNSQRPFNSNSGDDGTGNDAGGRSFASADQFNGWNQRQGNESFRSRGNNGWNSRSGNSQQYSRRQEHADVRQDRTNREERSHQRTSNNFHGQRNENIPFSEETSDSFHNSHRGENRRGNWGQAQARRHGRERNWRGRGNGTGDRQGASLNPHARVFQPSPSGSYNNGNDESDSNIPEYDRNQREYERSGPTFVLHGNNPEYDRNHREYERSGPTVVPHDKAKSMKTQIEGQYRQQNNASDVAKPNNQREALTDQLSRGNHECMVCCEKVRFSQPIWSCMRCFNVFHLSCIRKWVAKSDDETGMTGWNCPSCRSCYDTAPDGYYCFCGKTKNPKTSRYDIPHTCGQACGKQKPGGLNCEHTCIYPCHPGPCPSCEVQLTRYCGCGKTQAMVVCGSKSVLTCGNVCKKKINCGVHCCTRVCHKGDCNTCEEMIELECHCGREKKKTLCTLDSNLSKEYSCSNKCDKPLGCGYHKCEELCHPNSCGLCKTSPAVVLSCPCGQTGISEACKLAKLLERHKCTDPIPTCGKQCMRILTCGDLESRHKCQAKCHSSKDCPPCKLTSKVKCRCTIKTIEIACKELKARSEITCQKKCNKKRSCGKHKCNLTCCIDIDHVCPIICQRPLRCGNHKCTNLCHLNPCRPCETVSFDELTCECGAAIIYPPVPCGTRRPPCQLPCSREHPCDHPVHHPCHSEAACPPCTVLTEKWCHGGHELRKNVMCHIDHLSCGLPCKKMMPCERHTCPKVCHAGACLENGEICKLPCLVPKICGHHCGAPCHDGECPESKCKVMTDVVCPCGRRTDTLICFKRENEYERTVVWEYHKVIKNMEEAAKNKKEIVEISDAKKDEIMQSVKDRIPRSTVLECDKECAKLERNRKLAEALQLENADTTTTSIGTPNYSDFLMKFAKKNPQFIELIHKQLTDLVIKAKQSTKKNLTYGFNSMNRDKRHVVHEYSDHFGVLSESFDEEPNRNVVCFASREKSYLPSVSLVDAVFRPITVRSERVKPHDDVTFRPEKRTQIVGPSNWSMKTKQSASSSSAAMVTLNTQPGAFVGSADFPPL